MTSKKASDAVCEQLKSQRVITAWGAQIMLIEDLKKILNEESLKQIIGGYDLKRMEAAVIVKKIAEKSKWTKTFALLLEIGAGNLIESFVSTESIDSHLRVLIPDDKKVTQFVNGRSTFFTPVFEHEHSYDLELTLHLPFLENKPIKDQGANSRIFEVTIPLSCLAPHAKIRDLLKRQNESSGFFSNARNRNRRSLVRYNLIRKELEDDDLAEDEIRIHKQLRHRCIIPLFASYRYNGVFNLLLPKCGERMKPYLEQHTDWSESQYISAIHGLSGALKAIHDVPTADQIYAKKGCHGDLKPSNILVEGGDFILIDFGLGKIRQPSESSGGKHSMTGIYAAPECYDPEAHGVESFRACDIWSFGCILAELVVFMDTPGKDAFTNYERERRETQGGRTSTAFHKSGQHKELVWVPLDTIEKQTHSIVIKKLIQLIRSMLKINSRERPDAKAVEETIAGIKDMEQRPTSNPDRDVNPALGITEEVEAVGGRCESVVSALMTSANQSEAGEAELLAKKVQISEEVKRAYARFDQRNEPATRKTDLNAALTGFLKALAEMERPPKVSSPLLHRRIDWGLMVVEKELSHCRDTLTERMGHINEAERYCERYREGLRVYDITDEIHSRVEYHIIKGMEARLRFKQGEDKDQTDREKEDAIMGIDGALNELMAMHEGRYCSIYANVKGWRDRLARADI